MDAHIVLVKRHIRLEKHLQHRKILEGCYQIIYFYLCKVLIKNQKEKKLLQIRRKTKSANC